MRKILNAEPDKYIKNSLRGLIEERYLLFILEQSGINDEMTAHHLSNQQFQTFINLLKTFTFTVDGTLPLDKAFVTGGGISLKEIEPKTMMSKLVPGLFLCGEVLDIHGYTGGYNITSALVTGHVAGMLSGEFKIDQNIFLATQRLFNVYIVNGYFLSGAHHFNHETLMAISYFDLTISV